MDRTKINELRKEAAEKHTAAQALVDAAEKAKRSLTPEEQSQVDDLADAIDGLMGKIEEGEQALRTQRLKVQAAVLENRTAPGPIDHAARPAEQRVEVVRRGGRLRAFKGPNAHEDAYRAGRWLMGLLNPADTRSRQWAEEHGMEYRVAVEGVNTLGGVLVPTVLENVIIDLRESYGTARQFCQVVPMSSDHSVIPVRSTGLTAYFVSETDAATATSKGWTNINLVAKEVAVETRYSASLAEDAVISIADDLAREAAYCLAAKEDACLWNGDGTSTYGGMYGVATKIVSGSLATYAGSLAIVKTGTHNLFSEIDLTDLNYMLSKLPAYADATARIYCSRAFYHGVMTRLAMAAAGNTTQALMGNLEKNFGGYSVVLDQTLPAGLATDYNDLAMAFFGDLSKAVVLGDRRGITMMADPYSLSSYRQVKLVFTERFDIVAHSLGTATAAGPIIALVGSSS